MQEEDADNAGQSDRQDGDISGIDQSALSRQLAVWDVKSQLKVSQATVFVSGFNGIGVEIAKNLALAGVKGLTIQ
jgi:ubiquitin-activating enzyme E1